MKDEWNTSAPNEGCGMNRTSAIQDRFDRSFAVHSPPTRLCDVTGEIQAISRRCWAAQSERVRCPEIRAAGGPASNLSAASRFRVTIP